MEMRLRRLLPALAAVAALAFATTAAAAPAQAQPPPTVVSCSANYTIAVAWSTGFVADVTVTNNGNVNVVWQVEIHFVSSDVINAWNGVFTFAPQTVIIDPPTWAAGLAPGQVSPTAGFTATGDGLPSSVSVTCTN